jgi:broad specificity phosphatase PhoE
MRVVLVRHGNTFSPGEAAVWVGARTDLALVEKGRQQAEEVANQLCRAGMSINRIFAGPLRRTAETAAIIARIAGIAPETVVIDRRLTEIDYGDWEGLTSDKIRERYGNSEIDGWEHRNEWPPGARWPATKGEVVARVLEFFGDMSLQSPGHENAIDVVVSSNGIFRLFAETLGLPSAARKMATGNISLMTRMAGANWQVERWNAAPGSLLVQAPWAGHGRS